MNLIGNLQDEAKLFSSGVKLQSVAIGLNKIMYRQQIGEGEQENFKWAGNLVGRMDWNSEHYRQGEHPELCVIATTLRPRFYNSLRELKISNTGAEFSEGLYETLTSCGREVKLNVEELKQSHQVFQSMATCILTEVQNKYRMGQI